MLRCLDEELWGVRQDSQRSEIGLLYGLISKVRSLVFAKALVEEGLLRPERDYSRFKAAWDRLPSDRFSDDKRCSPLAINPYVMFRAAGQSVHFTMEELVGAMERLLRCNLQLVSSRQEAAMILQRALVEIARGGEGVAGGRVPVA
jgi:DNA polymerase III delta subunit